MAKSLTSTQINSGTVCSLQDVEMYKKRYKVIQIGSNPVILEDGGRIESPSEKLTTNNPMQQRMPTLELINGGNNVDRTSGSKAIFNLLGPAFLDRGNQLLPSNPEA
jgi:hypothetical protein